MIFTIVIPWGSTIIFFAMVRDAMRYAVVGVMYLCPHCHDMHAFPGFLR